MRCLDANQYLQGDIPVLVISLFGGIGGAFRTYDILGVRPMGLVHYDTHEPANRITSRRWPHAEIFLDVSKFTRDNSRFASTISGHNRDTSLGRLSLHGPEFGQCYGTRTQRSCIFFVL